MRNKIVQLLAAASLTALAVPAAHATCGGGGGGGMGGAMPRGGFSSAPARAYVVPWKVLNAGEAAVAAPYVLYWFPASAEEMDKGDMNASRLLTVWSSQCIGMQLVKPGDADTAAKFELAGKQPAALLVKDGKAIDHVDADRGRLNVSSVEKMISRALDDVEKSLDQQLDAAKKLETSDKDGAVAAYQKVWDQRCLAPKKARAAQKALGRLGVVVKDAQLRETDPNLSPAMNARMTKAMNEALAAELAENYDRAKSLYKAAAAIDPADPVPTRFLGELYRHHTGEWTLARQTFEKLLTMQPDPLGRAVALHGLGKMTIHMGDSAKGLALFEQSIEAFPLALTYRNLAVYWNSELQRGKADFYVKKALALDPADSYNLIFAATYLADSDRKEEALRIAKENEHVLSASYNLAAIYALLGNKGKAMELLKRHFYTYERYDDVRAMEMWEARVDYVFASIKNDPEFVKLTANAR